MPTIGLGLALDGARGGVSSLFSPTLSWSSPTLTISLGSIRAEGDEIWLFWTSAADPDGTPDDVHVVTAGEAASGTISYTPGMAAGTYNVQALHGRGDMLSAISNTATVTIGSTMIAPTLAGDQNGITVTIDADAEEGDVIQFFWTQAAAAGDTPDDSYTITSADLIDLEFTVNLDMPVGANDLEALHKRGTSYSAVSNTLEVTVVSYNPTVVGYQEATYTSDDGTTATFTIPTTGLTAFAGGAAGDVQDGDTLVLIFACSSSGAAPPSVADGTGMTWESLAALFGDDSNDINLRLARCVVSGAPASTITITGTAATANSNAAILVCLRDYTGTFDVTSVTATGNNDDTADPGAITPNTPNALIMAVYAASTNNLSANTYVGKGPSSGWENYHAVRATGGSTRYALLAVQTQDWTSGAVDPPAIDPGVSAATANAWAAYTIAITP